MKIIQQTNTCLTIRKERNWRAIIFALTGLFLLVIIVYVVATPSNAPFLYLCRGIIAMLDVLFLSIAWIAETYHFNKKSNCFILRRYSLSGVKTLRGNLDEIQGVQVEVRCTADWDTYCLRLVRTSPLPPLWLPLSEPQYTRGIQEQQVALPLSSFLGLPSLDLSYVEREQKP